jgi:hypothetical protein
VFDKFAPVCRRQALIDFARKPVVIIQEAFDRLLHKRFRRAAFLRRDARQFSLLVGGQLHFHGFIILENRPRATVFTHPFRLTATAVKDSGIVGNGERARVRQASPFVAVLGHAFSYSRG